MTCPPPPLLLAITATLRPIVLGAFLAVSASIAAITAAVAATDPSAICDLVAVEAARRTGVPLSVLKAISLSETGRQRDGAFRPWPWTVNMEGEGHWFGSAEEARAYVDREFARGARSFDVGCFQINYKWHGQAFRSLDELFDPMANALYAARFLQALHAEQGDWGRAAGAYHSRTPEFANRYQARFERLHEKLANAEIDAIPVIPDIVAAEIADPARPLAAVMRINRYPLLQTGASTGLGSLVPLGNGGGMRLFGSAAETADASTETN